MKSNLIQKRHPYTGNLNSEMLGDSKRRVSTLRRCFRSQVSVPNENRRNEDRREEQKATLTVLTAIYKIGCLSVTRVLVETALQVPFPQAAFPQTAAAEYTLVLISYCVCCILTH